MLYIRISHRRCVGSLIGRRDSGSYSLASVSSNKGKIKKPFIFLLPSRLGSSNYGIQTTATPILGLALLFVNERGERKDFLLLFREMSLKTSTISLAVAFFGVLAFIFGVIAENKKPASGSPIPGKDVVICKFPSDPTVALGSLSVISLALSTVLGLFSVFYSYKGKYVPKDALFHSTGLIVFFVISLAVSALGGAMMLWATITESLHHIHNIHQNLDYECPTAKTGLFGGAAFLALDACLFWLICQMLTLNARADYLEEDPKGDYGQVLATDYDERPKDHGITP